MNDIDSIKESDFQLNKILLFENGEKYEGNFKKDKKEGEGEEIYIDNSNFKGLFTTNNKRNNVYTFIKNLCLG